MQSLYRQVADFGGQFGFLSCESLFRSERYMESDTIKNKKFL